ncbi:MAG TPA: alpha/beta hydrolase [Thermoanaerobaculia bacterium]|jgi:pimeloyl-ACP methyl ester carboxylesterase|nr:alpha/beta hydrolase [Thermoanaerobaculia bacterium]
MKRFLPTLLLVSCAHMSPQFIEGPQGKLRVDDGGSGSGVPVFFVHGNGANHTQWRYQLAHLRPTRRAVAFDLRGMGESDVPKNGDYSVDAMSDDVQAIAEALHLRRFVIVGHSYGGAVVAAYIAKHPERVAGVVFADAAGNVKITDEAASSFFAALRANQDKVVRQWFGPILANASDAVKEEVFASVAKTPVDALASALNGLRSFDSVRAVETYHGPKIAIAAAANENPTSLHMQLPSLRVVKMEGVSHWLMLDKPDEFNRILDDFLRAGERPSRPQ